MNRWIALIGSVFLGLLLSVTTFAILTCDKGRSEVTVSFVNEEISSGKPFSYDLSERLTFAVRNAGSKLVSFNVFEIENKHGNWVPSPYILGDVEAGQNAQLYLYLPLESHPKSVRMRMMRKASAVQKIQFAMRLLIERVSGRYLGKEFWFDGLSVPAREFTVKLDREAEATGSRQRRDHASVDN